MAERERIYYRDGYKYQLAGDYSTQVEVYPDHDIYTWFISLTMKGRLSVTKGYAWDGASGPTVDTKDSMRASLVHDALYQLMREGQLSPARWRAQADHEFRRICLEDDMPLPRADAWFVGVRVGASGAAEPKNDRPVLTAP